MQFLRSLAFNIVMFGAGAVLSFWGLFVWKLTPDRVIIVPITWGKVSLWALKRICRIELVIEGAEHLPKGGAVIAAQHQSAMDILIWLSVTPKPAFVFKRELQKIPMFGDLLVPTGMIPVNRGGGGAALREMVVGCTKAVADGRQVVIFPEGTRMPASAPGVLRNGIAALVRAVHVPTVPVGTDSGLLWGPKAFHKSPGKVHLWVQPPLEQGLSRDEIIARLEDVFYGRFKEDSASVAEPAKLS